MEKKQSSIGWLVEEINKQKAWADPSKLEPLFEQAKEMHKEEIIRPLISMGWSEEIAESHYNVIYGGNNEKIS